MARRNAMSDPLNSGTTMSGGSADPISGQFSQIRSLIGAPSPAVPSTPTPVAGGPTSGFAAGLNSSDILRQGINLVGGTGTNMGTVGSSLLGQGVGLLQDPTAFFQALLSGDPTRTTQALAPTAATISSQYAPMTSQAQGQLPKGGYASSTLAELPFAQAGQVGNAALGLQSQAAQGLTGLGTSIAGLGQNEQQMGLQGLQQIINAALGKMGVTSSITQNLANTGQFLSSII